MPGVLQPVQTAAVALAALLAPSAGAGTLYDFAWSGNSYSASGSMELSSSVGLGDSFTSSDVLDLQVELFDGATSVGTIGSADFVAGSDVLEGTRTAPTLSITDVYLTAFGTTLGCDAVGCFLGLVQFHTPSTPNATVDFGTTEAARASFVFTEVPEPRLAASLALAGLTLATLRLAASDRPPDVLVPAT